MDPFQSKWGGRGGEGRKGKKVKKWKKKRKHYITVQRQKIK